MYWRDRIYICHGSLVDLSAQRRLSALSHTYCTNAEHRKLQQPAQHRTPHRLPSFNFLCLSLYPQPPSLHKITSPPNCTIITSTAPSTLHQPPKQPHNPPTSASTSPSPSTAPAPAPRYSPGQAPASAPHPASIWPVPSAAPLSPRHAYPFPTYTPESVSAPHSNRRRKARQQAVALPCPALTEPHPVLPERHPKGTELTARNPPAHPATQTPSPSRP